MCFWGEQYRHPCLLVGPVVNGKPVAHFNRRVLYVPLSSDSVETGTYDAVRTGGGKIKEIQWLGRVTVLLEDHLCIVENWVDETLEGSRDGLSDAVIHGLQNKMTSAGDPPAGSEVMQLDVFRAVIVNRRENQVFVYRKPSSFP
jgi:hypothetical protein